MRIRLGLSLVAIALLSACGGGGSGGAASSATGLTIPPTIATPTPLPSLSPASAAFLNLSLSSLSNYANQTQPTFYTGVGTNTPPTNQITNAGATLGRVIFNDPRMSITGTVSCASCHKQVNGFTDTLQFSNGVNGGVTTKHTMRLANVAYYQPGTMFWDKRAASVEDQVVFPIQNTAEMGWDTAHGGLSALITKMATLPYYPELFQFVYGDTTITQARIESAVAQYERSMLSTNSRWDTGEALVFTASATNPFDIDIPTFTAQENRGRHLFIAPRNAGGVGCAGCHRPPSFALDGNALDNGLDLGQTTIFKAPSLKNVGITGPYMHDGRFATLADVVEHYNSGILSGPELDPRLIQPNGTPIQLNLTASDKAAIVAFLMTLDDPTLATDARFSSPFRQ